MLAALLARAEQIGSYELGMSQREASLLTGIDNDTASRSLIRLARAGFIKVTGRTARGTLTYSLHNASVFIQLPTYLTTSKTDAKCNNRRSELVSTELGAVLGPAAVDVYVTLSAEPHTVTEIAAMTGLSKATVSRALRVKLAGKKLAERQGKGWILGSANPDDYNPETCSYGEPIVANRKARYAKERKEYRATRKRKGNGETYTQEKPDRWHWREGLEIFCGNCCVYQQEYEEFPEVDGMTLCFECYKVKT